MTSLWLFSSLVGLVFHASLLALCLCMPSVVSDFIVFSYLVCGIDAALTHGAEFLLRTHFIMGMLGTRNMMQI